MEKYDYQSTPSFQTLKIEEENRKNGIPVDGISFFQSSAVLVVVFRESYKTITEVIFLNPLFCKSYYLSANLLSIIFTCLLADSKY